MKSRIEHIRLERLCGLHPLLSEHITAGHLSYVLDRDLITAEAVQALLRANPIPAVRKDESRDEWWALGQMRYVQLARLSLPGATQIPVQAFNTLTDPEIREILWSYLYLDPLINVREPGSEHRLLEHMRRELPVPLADRWHPEVKSRRSLATALGVDRRSLAPTEQHPPAESTWDQIRRKANERE